jgi:hypothetical protein
MNPSAATYAFCVARHASTACTVFAGPSASEAITALALPRPRFAVRQAFLRGPLKSAGSARSGHERQCLTGPDRKVSNALRRERGRSSVRDWTHPVDPMSDSVVVSTIRSWNTVGTFGIFVS